MMKTRAVLVVFLVSCWLATSVRAGDSPSGHFTAMAEVDTASGTRSMGFDIVVSRPLSLAQVQPFKTALENGGQPALLALLRQNSSGSFVLGGLEYPINLIVAEPLDDGVRYIVVTARNFSYQEAAEGGSSLDFPFAVAVFTVPEFGSGDGKIYPKASLSIDADGHVKAQAFKDRTGRLKDVSQP
jgi:hypothetical protein